MSDAKTTSAGDLTRSLSDAIQSHPLPAALIGMGLLRLFSGGKSLLDAGGGGAGGAKSASPDTASFADQTRTSWPRHGRTSPMSWTAKIAGQHVQPASTIAAPRLSCRRAADSRSRS
jgi:hypothetical protein